MLLGGGLKGRKDGGFKADYQISDFSSWTVEVPFSELGKSKDGADWGGYGEEIKNTILDILYL